MSDPSLSNHLTAFSLHPAKPWRRWWYLLVLPTASPAFSTHKSYMQMCSECSVCSVKMQKMLKKHIQRIQYLAHFCATLQIIRHKRVGWCNVGVRKMAFFGKNFKKMYTALSISYCHSQKR
jgi:hypothetical protein